MLAATNALPRRKDKQTESTDRHRRVAREVGVGGKKKKISSGRVDVDPGDEDPRTAGGRDGGTVSAEPQSWTVCLSVR